MKRTKSKPLADANDQTSTVTPPGFTVSGVQGPGSGRTDGDAVAMLRRKLRLSGEVDVGAVLCDALGEIDRLDSLLAWAMGKRPMDTRSLSDSAQF